MDFPFPSQMRKWEEWHTREINRSRIKVFNHPVQLKYFCEVDNLANILLYLLLDSHNNSPLELASSNSVFYTNRKQMERGPFSVVTRLLIGPLISSSWCLGCVPYLLPLCGNGNPFHVGLDPHLQKQLNHASSDLPCMGPWQSWSFLKGLQVLLYSAKYHLLELLINSGSSRKLSLATYGRKMLKRFTLGGWTVLPLHHLHVVDALLVDRSSLSQRLALMSFLSFFIAV